MTHDLLAVYREVAVPLHPGQLQRGPAGAGALGGRLTDAGALQFETGLLAAASAMATSMTRGQTR
jgi:hypothetical protein